MKAPTTNLIARALMALLALQVCAQDLAAQSTNGILQNLFRREPAVPSWEQKITGTVTDPSGAPAPGVEVTLFPRVGSNAVSITDATGRYDVIYLPMSYGPLTTSYLTARDPSRNLANATITAYGPGLPNAGRTRSDARGHFELKTTDEPANVHGAYQGAYVILPANAGDTNVVLGL